MNASLTRDKVWRAHCSDYGWNRKMRKMLLSVVASAAVSITLASGGAGASDAGEISRRSIGGATIGMTLATARKMWGQPSWSFVKKRGVTYFWSRRRAFIRFKNGRANEITVRLRGGNLATRYGDRAGTSLSLIKRHFPAGTQRRKCCWVISYAVNAERPGYVLAFTFDSRRKLEAADLIDRRSYMTCFGTAACD